LKLEVSEPSGVVRACPAGEPFLHSCGVFFSLTLNRPCAGDKALLSVTCKNAPFNASSVNCYNEIVSDCAHQFESAKKCAECIVLYEKDLAANNCTKADVIGMTALCSKVNESSVWHY
jgi:hypothetical protein